MEKRRGLARADPHRDVPPRRLGCAEDPANDGCWTGATTPGETSPVGLAASAAWLGSERGRPHYSHMVAERVGFEPTVPVKAQRFSRPPDSTTLAPLRASPAWPKQSLILPQPPRIADSAVTPAASGRSPHERPALVGEDAGHGLEAVVERQRVRVDERADGAAFRVVRTVDHGRHARVHDARRRTSGRARSSRRASLRRGGSWRRPKPPRAARRSPREPSGRCGGSAGSSRVRSRRRPSRRPRRSAPRLRRARAPPARAPGA